MDDLQLKKALSRRAGYPVVVSERAGSVTSELSAQNSQQNDTKLTQ
ncbi:hypothetical protein [Klebsiella aerogenes]